MSEWISVKDHMPNETEYGNSGDFFPDEVIVLCQEGGTRWIDRDLTYKGKWQKNEDLVTHWFYIPELPPIDEERYDKWLHEMSEDNYPYYY